MLQTQWKLAAQRRSQDDTHAGPESLAQGRMLPLGVLMPPRRARLEHALARGESVGLLWVDLMGFVLFERLYGEHTGACVSEHLHRILEEELERMLGPGGLFLVEGMGRAAFITIFTARAMNLTELADMAMRLKLSVRTALTREVISLTGQSLSLQMGYALLPACRGRELEHAIYNAISDAREVAEGTLDPSKLALMEEFRQVMERPLLRAVYQPIVDLRTSAVLGWESLARGPADSHFANPSIMFDFAEEVGRIFPLERCCREQAISGLGPLRPGQKLFLNIHPQTLGDPSFRSGETLNLLEAHGLAPYQVVFEITERHSVKDFTLFHRTLEHYRSQGYQVAIDDVGTGYSGLSRLAEVRPDYIKVDMGLVRGIDTNPIQRALIETLVTFADNIGCGIICEGIETETELSSLISMGVHFGQGFYLGRPAGPKPQPAVRLPSRVEIGPGSGDWKCSIPVRDLAEPASQVTPDTCTRAVKDLLDSRPISGVVVVQDKRPLGLVMSHNLDRQLGTYFGTSLYYERSVDRLMDTSPLIVEGSAPVEQVASTAMRRDRFKLYDHIIVTEGGLIYGVVSVQKMLDALARVQVEMARGMSPLTGLPGNVALEREIERRLREGKPSSFIYADLDHFKVYNDSYGFESGDKMILFTSRILTWAARRHGGRGAFVGHVGGDDFVAAVDPSQAERVCRAVVRCFGRLVGQLYTPDDRARGFVQGKDRQGAPRRFPLVSVSLGIVDCQGPCDMTQIGLRAAELKRYAKSKPGNVFVRDRRSPLGLAQDAPAQPPASAPPPKMSVAG